MQNTISLNRKAKVIAIHTQTGEVRKDMGNKSKPRIYTVESVDNNEIKLYQVGSYEIPLKFNLDTGLPYLAEHSRASMLYKIWQNYRIEVYNVSDSE